MTEFSKSVKIKLDYTNWGSWKVQVVRALKVAGCAQYIGEDGGRALELEELLYERPEAPTVAETGIAGTVMTETEAARIAKYDIDMAAFRKARKIRHFQRDMDGVCIANAIASTCGDAISNLVERQSRGSADSMQPMDLWKFLEKTTKASLVPARAWLTEKMLTARQGADESLETYVDRLQTMESELCMISDDPDAVRAGLTMKLVNSVHDDYGMAVTMIKNILMTSFSDATDPDRWAYALGALREEEQVRIRRAARDDVHHGYAAVPRRPGVNNAARGFNNAEASTSGQPQRREYVRKCWNCGSKNHVQDDCPEEPDYEYRAASRGGRNGRGGRGRGRSQHAMASLEMSQQRLFDRIDSLSAALADLQAGTSHAMSARARGMYLKLHALILDSGCSNHMSPNRESFTDYKKLAFPGVVRFGGGTFAKSVGIGTLTITRPDGSILLLAHVLHVPDLVATLLSVSQLTIKSKCCVLFGEHEDAGAYVYRKSDNKLMLTATLTSESIYVVDVSTPIAVALFAQPKETAELWHRRMGHRSYRSLAHMQRLGLLQGCQLTPAEFVQASLTPCETCIQAKTHKASHTTAAIKSEILLHRLIVDMKGPLPLSVCGCKYYVTITDEASGECAVKSIRSKTEAAAFVIQTIILWETQVQAPGFHRVQRVRTDNGTEFMSELYTYLASRGIQRELGAPYTPQQIGVAERQNRTTIEPSRAMLIDAKLPVSMWPYAVSCACVLLNSSVSEGKTKSPHELFYGQRAPTQDLRVFGCPAWVMLPKPQITALGSRVRTKGVFIGYPMPLGSRQFLVLIDGKVIRSSDVQFYESQIAPVAPVTARPDVAVAVPTPGLSDSDNFPDDDDTRVRARFFDAPDVTEPAQLVQPANAPEVPVDQPVQQLQHIQIVPADDVGWPVPHAQNLVQPQDAQLGDAEQEQVQVQVHVQEHDADQQQQQLNQPELQQTHAGRARRTNNPAWREARIPGFTQALTSSTSDINISSFRKQRKPGWGSCRGVKHRLAMHVATHRYGMQRPDLAWRPELHTVPENPDVDDAHVAFPLARPVCSSLHAQNAEMQQAMASAESSPRNFPKPGLTPCRTVDCTGIPSSLRTSVPCMPSPEPPRVLGDMSVMPRTIEEALARPDHVKWREALEVELGAMHAMKVWQVASLPAGATAVGCRMLFDIKQPSGRYKCRLVAQGFSQVQGQDYSETYAPVAAMQTLRVFWSTCAHFGLTIRQLDVSTAFLHAPLEEAVYMRQLRGLRSGSAADIWELFKAVYGLKQAPRAWNKLLSSKLIAAGWVQSDADPSLYLQYNSDNEVVAAALIYVDDLQLASKDPELVDSLVKEITGWWPCTIQAADRFLGIEISHDMAAGTLTVHQQSYIDSMVSKYGCADEFDAVLPLPPCVHFSKDAADMGTLLQDGNLYSSLVGSLNHLSLCTRPDISYAVSLLSRYLKCPRAAHWGAAVHLLRFVKATRTRSLVYGTDVGIKVYADASYRRGPDARSTTGYVVLLHGAAVAWGSKLQAYAALSTTEAEIQASVSAGRVAIWMGYVLPELGQPLQGPITVFGDNQAALSLLAEKRHTKMSQHMEPIDSRLRWWVSEKRLRFVYVATSDNLADCLTKALPRPALSKCCAGMGLFDVGNV